MGTCTRCRMEFKNWLEYNTHKMTNTCYLQILPIKTSTKTKEQIVDELETKLGKINFYGKGKEAVRTVKPIVNDQAAVALKSMLRKWAKGVSHAS